MDLTVSHTIDKNLTGESILLSSCGLIKTKLVHYAGKKTATKIEKLIHNNEEITEPHDIANRLNNYFCSIGANFGPVITPLCSV